jgi:alpha-beta hydrolase superfamily lysophospholipase
MTTRRRQSVRLPLPAGGELAGSLSWQGEPGPAAVVYVHGFGSTHAGEKAAALEAACARRGWTFAAFDFRGHGGSPGSLLELRGSTLQEDLEQARGYLAQGGVRTLFLAGSSMGGWASAWFALRNKPEVPALVGVAPAFGFLERRWESLAEPQRDEWRRTGRLRVRNEWLDVEVGYGLMEERDNFSFENLVAGWSTPLLVFHGMRDEVAPYLDSLELARRASFPAIELRLYKDGDHRLLAYKDEMAEEACRFFARWWPRRDA